MARAKNGKFVFVVAALFIVVAVVYTVSVLYINDNKYQGLRTGEKDSHHSRQSWPDDQEDDQLDNEVCDAVQTFLIFIGYPRSGHTLISSLLDAHPNAIVANEFDVIGKWQEWDTANKNKYYLFNQLYLNSREESEIGYRSVTVPHRYNYSVPGQWQGRFDKRILVIGAKKGGKTTRQLMKLQNMDVLKEIQQVLDIPFRFLHVVRNPYDNIATMLLRAVGKRTNAELGEKINDPENLDKQIISYFALAERNNELKSRLPGEVHEIHSSELIKRPKETLLGICQFLHLTCDRQYIEDCSKRIFPEATKTRYSVMWTDKQKELVREKLQTFQSLKDYRFDD
ncbi:uncharacterized protein LOC144657760 isoform X2 [Oculina patagonica]